MKLSSDDLLVILALCRERTLERAGRFLERDTSSVFRAINRIESKANALLFERSKSGFRPFPVAEELADKGREISEALSEAGAICADLGNERKGRLRVTTTDVLLEHVILPNMRVLWEKLPHLKIEFSTSNQFAQLWERGFDVAVRPSTKPSDYLLGQFVAKLEYVMVCAPSYHLADDARNGALSTVDWLVPGGALLQHPVRKWFSANVTSNGSVASFDSMNLMFQAVRQGLGVAVIPNLAPLTEGLVQIQCVDINEASEIWCLYHPSNRGNPLVQAFCKLIKQALS